MKDLTKMTVPDLADEINQALQIILTSGGNICDYLRETIGSQRHIVWEDLKRLETGIDRAKDATWALLTKVRE